MANKPITPEEMKAYVDATWEKCQAEAWQEPVAWMHNYIADNVITHRPADLDRNPDRWEALYKIPPPCQTCQALARTVMMDQTSHDMAPHQWQGLTDDDIAQAMYRADAIITGPMQFKFAREIEAKLKEKNT